MIKSIQLVLMSVVIIALGILYYLHFSAQKIAYVDSSRLINNYQGMVDARKDFQKKSTVWKANVDTLMVEVQNAIKDYEKGSGKMTEKEKELNKELIRTKQRQLADYQKAMNDKAGQEDAQMTSQVLEQVNSYIKKYGESRDYKIIIAATQYGNVVYASDGLDLTDEILEGLNQEYRGQ